VEVNQVVTIGEKIVLLQLQNLRVRVSVVKKTTERRKVYRERGSSREKICPLLSNFSRICEKIEQKTRFSKFSRFFSGNVFPKDFEGLGYKEEGRVWGGWASSFVRCSQFELLLRGKFQIFSLRGRIDQSI
jgi:hypothetical protein